MHQMLGASGSSSPIADEATGPRHRGNVRMDTVVPQGGAWPEDVRLAVLVARAQGIAHTTIAHGLTEVLGKKVDAASVRYFCSRHGVVLQKRLAPLDVPLRYRRDYRKIRAIVGVTKARKEIERLIERDKRAA